MGKKTQKKYKRPPRTPEEAAARQRRKDSLTRQRAEYRKKIAVRREIRKLGGREAAVAAGLRMGLPRTFTRESYKEYLASKWWKAKRGCKLKSVGYRCEKCQRTRPNVVLHVHHLHYLSLGRERNCDLQVLCESCHKGEHPDWW